MKIVYVIEKNDKPTELSAGQVQAYRDLKWVHAWRQVTPIIRLETEKPVPYISVQSLIEIINSTASSKLRERLIEVVCDLESELDA